MPQHQNNPSKPHIANILIKRGLATSVTEAITRYLFHKYPETKIDAIDLVKDLAKYDLQIGIAHGLGGVGEKRVSIEEFESNVKVMKDAEVEIIETHHDKKLDAPSGTALMLFNAVKEEREKAFKVEGRSGHCLRQENEVGISSIRLCNVVGIHEVIVSNGVETITLKHEAHDRALFANGAVKAALYLAGKGAGLYDMKKMLGEV